MVRALGRKSALAVVGSSQGSAASLNAFVERPTLGAALALVHPVSHAPLERFGAIAQPVLLMYDCDDPGHPVTVGRRLRPLLRRARYFEFSSGADPGWDAHHLPSEVWGGRGGGGG